MTDGDGFNTFSYWIIKLDSSGNKVWDKIYDEGERISGSEVEERANSIQQTSDGGYIVAGYIFSFGCGASCIIKLDGSGNKEWDKIYGEFAISVKQTSDGGYIVVGHTCIDEYMALYDHFSDYWIKKLDGSGHEEWTKTYGWPGDDYAESIQQTSDGGYIVAGIIYSDAGDIIDGNYREDDYGIIKLDSVGNKIWDKTYGGSNNDGATSIQQTSDGGYIVAGYTLSLIHI